MSDIKFIAYSQFPDDSRDTADDNDQTLDEMYDLNAGNPDAQAGDDCPTQRPITDNKAGG